MSAGVCGKRVGYEEMFGSSPKRSRRSSFGGSPDRPREFGSGSEDSVSALLRMFPALDPEFITTVLRNHNNEIEGARQSLSALSSDFSERNKAASFDPAVIGNCTDIPIEGTSNSNQIPEQDFEGVNDTNQKFESRSGSEWVDLFVREMMASTNLDDARGRAASILEAFERNVTTNSRAAKELEHASLKENLQRMLSNNQILKKAVAIQHERNLEHEGNEREAHQLKLMLSQYQEQVRNLEMNNYTLKLHLQRAHESNSLSGRFHPDIY